MRERKREREQKQPNKHILKKLYTCELIHSNKFLFDMEASSIECRRHGKTGIFDRRSSEDATLTQKRKYNVFMWYFTFYMSKTTLDLPDMSNYFDY